MNRKYTQAALLLVAAMMAAGCADHASTAQDNAPQKMEQNQNQNKNNSNTDTEEKVDDDIALSGLSDVSESEIDLSSGASGLRIAQGGTYTLHGSGSQVVVVEAGSSDVTLKLSSASISVADGPAIFVRSAGKVTIELEGENSLAANSHQAQSALNAALYSRVPMAITGSGSLKIEDAAEHGIKCKEDLLIESGTLDINAAQDGIHASDSLDVSEGTLKMTTGDEGVEANGSIRIQNGTWAIQSQGDGIRAEKQLEITDGTFDITSQNEGLESKDTLSIDGGDFTIRAKDDGINAANVLTINGGRFDIVSSTNDGIDSNGTLSLNGGDLSVVGLHAPEGAFDTDNTPFVVAGGRVVGLSATATLPNQVDQNTIAFQADTSFTQITLQQDGKTILDWSAPSDVKANGCAVMISTPDLSTGKTVTVLLDGNEFTSFTVEEGLTTNGNISTMGGGGMMGGRMGGNNNQIPEDGQMPQDGQRPEMPGGEQPEFNEDMFNGERPELPEGEMPQRPDGSTDSNGSADTGRMRKGNRNQNQSNNQTDTNTGSTEAL